jgi:hypothetical protein
LDVTMNHHSAATASPFRRCAAWVLLFVFLMGHTPVLPAVTESVAWIDGGHTVQFTSTQNGVTLTLHHQSSGTGAISHEHSRWLSVVTVFTRDSGPGHSDHVMALPTGGSADITSDMAAAVVLEMPVAEIPGELPGPFARHGSDSALRRSVVRSAARPPVSVILQSVQLLI